MTAILHETLLSQRMSENQATAPVDPPMPSAAAGTEMPDDDNNTVKASPTSSRPNWRVADDGTLVKFSKRIERQRRKQQMRQRKSPAKLLGFLDLPFDLLYQVFCMLRPSHLFRLSRTCRSMRCFILEHQDRLARNIIKSRYSCLEQCLRLPVLLSSVDVSLHAALQDADRHKKMGIHKRPFQHIQAADPSFICTCLTCMLRWNSLCLAIDFAHWQEDLDRGEPLPIIPRGKNPKWNADMIEANGAIVRKALFSKLWYACILESHLDSTVRAIRRQRQNKGNMRRHFVLSPEDEQSGTDAFLQRRGPATVDFPYRRDEYLLLEAYMPNRSWFAEQERWAYLPAEQHETDLGWLRRWTEQEGPGKTMVIIK